MDSCERPPFEFDLDFASEPEEDDLEAARLLDLNAAASRPTDAPRVAARLEIIIGDERHELPVDQPRLLIGRTDPATGQTPDVDFSADTAVSRRHAEIRNREGTLVVVDLGSTNGTKLNGEDLAPGEERPLADGDEITVGEHCRLLVRLA